MCGNALVRSTKKIVPCLQSSMVVVVASWSGAACLLLVQGSCSSLRETWIPTCAVMPSLQKLFSNITTTPNTQLMTTALLLKVKVMEWPSMFPDLNLLSTCGDFSSGRCRSTMCLASISSVISLWRIGRGCQQQPVQLWWIPRPGGLRHKYCPYKILTLWTQFWHVHLGCTDFCCQLFGQ